jgi:hypothetical protein
MNNTPSYDLANLRPSGTDEALTVADSAVSLTAAFTCTHVLLTNGPQPVRAVFDGAGTPTASEGHYLPAGWSAIVPFSVAKAAQFIRQGATSSDIHATPLVR